MANVSGLLKALRNHEAGIGVLGMGHVGLPTALGFAELGWRVIGADNDSDKISLIAGGQCPFYEPGLKELLSKQLSNAQFRVTNNIEEAIRSSAILFLCVGTPQKETGEADLTEIEVLARTISRNLNGYKLIVEKSTVPAITGCWIRKTVGRYLAAFASPPVESGTSGKQIAALADSEGFDVASNPEFLQEGKALEDFFRPDRIVCGVSSNPARQLLAGIYEPLGCPVIFTDVNTAELIKHAANSFLATKISFANMVADICEAVGADVTEVARGIGLDLRIGTHFLNAGLGFGGYCLPKDLRALIYLAEEKNVDASLLRSTERINQSRVERYLRKARNAVWIPRGKVIGVLGLSFKAGTDDIREAPSIKVISALRDEGALLKLHDPMAIENAKLLIPERPGHVTYHANPYDVSEGAHALLILTEWPEFRALDFHRIRNLMQLPVIVDGRNLLDGKKLSATGFEYFSMGRGDDFDSSFYFRPTIQNKNTFRMSKGKRRKTTSMLQHPSDTHTSTCLQAANR